MFLIEIIIITDSNCDLPVDYINQNNVHVIPFTFYLNNKDYIDDFGKSIGYKEFYNKIRMGGMPTTSQITAYTFEGEFRKFTSKGYSIIYIGFSSGLSETYNNAVMARKALLEEDSSIDITLIDSKSATVGQGLIVFYACEMLKQGKSKQEIVEWIENNKLKVNHWFTIDCLEHLKRGGRISTASATIGTLLDVKLVLNVGNDGRLNIIKKVRGRKKSIRTLVEEFKARVVNPEEQTIFISHGDCAEHTEYLKKLLMSEVKVKSVIINYSGPVIGAHTGPGMICISFIGRDRTIVMNSREVF